MSGSQFTRLQALLAETAGAGAIVLTKERSPQITKFSSIEFLTEFLGLRVDSFIGVVSVDFSALLVGERVAEGHRISLTFEPEAIALFLEVGFASKRSRRSFYGRSSTSTANFI